LAAAGTTHREGEPRGECALRTIVRKLAAVGNRERAAEDAHCAHSLANGQSEDEPPEE
jgi:hypothetical protein